MVFGKIIKMSCSGCNKSVRGCESEITCVDCSSTFHASCVKMTADDVGYIEENNQTWRCEDCQSGRRKSLALATAAGKGEVTLSDIIVLLNNISQKQDKMEKEIKRMERDLGKSIDYGHETLDSLSKRFDEQCEKITACFGAMEIVTAELNAVKKENAELRDRMEELEQYSRSNMLEVNGIPQTINENLTDIICKMSNALGHQISEKEIDICHRMKSRKEGQTPPIVVRFVRRMDRNEIIQRRKVKRDFSTRDMGQSLDSRVYINESLSLSRRKVFATARELYKKNKIKYIWVKNGKILARKEDGAPAIELKNLGDVEVFE